MDFGQPLLHHLPGAHDVGAVLEDEHDRRRPGNRLRADFVEPRRTVEHVGFQRHRDQGLDFGGGKPERLGLNLDIRLRELRQNVDRHFVQLRDAVEDQPAATAATNRRDCRLAPMIQRNIRGPQLSKTVN